jgi:hypothetical protein
MGWVESAVLGDGCSHPESMKKNGIAKVFCRLVAQVVDNVKCPAATHNC